MTNRTSAVTHFWLTVTRNNHEEAQNAVRRLNVPVVSISSAYSFEMVEGEERLAEVEQEDTGRFVIEGYKGLGWFAALWTGSTSSSQAGDRPPPLEIPFSMMAMSGYPPEDFVMAPQGGDRPPSPLDDSRGGGGSMRVSSPPRDLRCLAQGMGCLFTPPGPGVLIAAGQRTRLPI